MEENPIEVNEIFRTLRLLWPNQWMKDLQDFVFEAGSKRYY